MPSFAFVELGEKGRTHKLADQRLIRINAARYGRRQALQKTSSDTPSSDDLTLAIVKEGVSGVELLRRSASEETNTKPVKIAPALPTNRLIVHQQFRDQFFPRKPTASRSFYEDFWSYTSKPGAVLAAALDTMALVLLGTSAQDGRLLLAGVEHYNKTIRLVHSNVSRISEGATPPDDLLGAIYVLGWCHLFRTAYNDDNHQASSILGKAGTHAHFTAASCILQNRRKNSSRQSDLHAVLTAHASYGLALRAMFARQSLSLDSVPLQRPLFWPPNLWEFHTSVWMVLGGLLERVDRCVARRPPYDEPLSLLADLCKVESNLSRCFLDWTATEQGVPSNMELYELPKLSSSLSNTELALEAFPMYRSFDVAFHHTNFLMAKLSVEDALLDLSKNFSNTAPSTLHFRESEWYHSASQCASALRSCIPYLFNHSHGMTGKMRCLNCLAVAQKWYDKIHDDKNSAWCTAAKTLVEHGGINGLYS